ncbi:MAG TPA: protein kinase [Streptosporangiaceae bacterium]|nr:protein kinase [Streptosporangiaceae bacterium]
MSSLPLVGCDWAGYQLRAVLGRGGMSTVYKAEHPRIGSVVALKVMAPELAADDVFRARFLEESRMAASLNHPNIIPIFDMGPCEGLLFIAMHYVAGTDLRAVLKEHHRISPSQALLLIGQTARALDAAHRHGLVHRDVKPGNILVERGADDDDPDHVYLADFGITKHMTSRSGLTSTGHLMGTIDYSAPEQIRGRSVDGRADMYSLGCVLYECLTGHVPFDKDHDAAVIWAHVEESPPKPSTVQPDLPQSIDDVILRAMAKDPDDRYQTCRDLVAAAHSAFPDLDLNPPTVLASHSASDDETSWRPHSMPPSPPEGRHTHPPIVPALASRRDSDAATIRLPPLMPPLPPDGRQTETFSPDVTPRRPHSMPPSPPDGRQTETFSRDVTPRRPHSMPPSPPGGTHPETMPPRRPPPPGTEPTWPRRRRGPSRRLLAALGGLVLIIAAAIGTWAATNQGGAPHSRAQGGASQNPPSARLAGGWRWGHESPFPVQQVPAAVLDGRIWVAGGLTTEESATPKTEFYDPTSDTWAPGPALPVPLHHAMMVTYHHTLMVIGGFTPQGGKMMGAASARVLSLNKAQNGWTDGPRLHFARGAGAAAVVGNKIVVVGGRTGLTEKPIAPTEVYDGTSWHDAAKIPITGDHVGAASDGTYLYAVGGRKVSVGHNTAAVQRFDPATGQWTQLKAMPSAASDLGAAVIDGQLVTVGGESPGSVFTTVRAYNLATSTWSSLPNLAAARHGAAVTAIGNTLYDIDGAALPGHNASTPNVQILHFSR